jgi:hypothetical protein
MLVLPHPLRRVRRIYCCHSWGDVRSLFRDSPSTSLGLRPNHRTWIRLRARRNDWPQLCQDCFFARPSKKSDPLFAIDKAKDGRNGSSAVPQTEVRAIIKFDAGYLKQSDSLAISSRTPFNIMEGKAHPVANSTRTGCLDSNTSASKFASVISTVVFKPGVDLVLSSMN